MSWTIFAMVLILAMTGWRIHRQRNRGTRSMYRDYRDIGPDEMRTRVEGTWRGRHAARPLPPPVTNVVPFPVVGDRT